MTKKVNSQINKRKLPTKVKNHITLTRRQHMSKLHSHESLQTLSTENTSAEKTKEHAVAMTSQDTVREFSMNFGHIRKKI